MTRALTVIAIFLGWLAAGAAIAADAPKRVVIAGPALVEIAYLLGAADVVAAVDANSTFPPETADKANVGYFRRLAAEPILSLSPDAIVLSPDAGPPETVTQLQATGIPVHIAPHVTSPADVTQKFEFMGAILGKPEAAAKLSEDYTAGLGEIERLADSTGKRAKVLFIIGMQGAPVVGGRDTVVHAMITLAGGDNAADFDGYKPMSDEAIVGAAPEVVLMMPDRLKGAGGVDGLLKLPSLAHTPAARNRHVVTMDGGLLLRLGPRTVEAIRRLREDFATPPATKD